MLVNNLGLKFRRTRRAVGFALLACVVLAGAWVVGQWKPIGLFDPNPYSVGFCHGVLAMFLIDWLFGGRRD